ncbi:MAG: ABC transporter ATP-binding protein [Oligoflexales bacterium]|nr:ABC transporter ATP-binding protein [Oligoflexales bacterium]
MKSPEKNNASFFGRYFIEPSFKHKKILFIISITLLFMSFSQGLLIFVLKPFLTALVSLGKEESSLALSQLISPQFFEILGWNPSLVIEKEVLISNVAIVIVCAGLLRGISLYIYQISQMKIALLVSFELRTKLFKKLLNLSFLQIRSKPASYWATVIMNDVQQFQVKYSELLLGLSKNIAMIFASIVALALVHIFAAIILLAALPLVAVAMGRSSKKIAFHAQDFQKQLRSMADILFDLRQRFAFIKAQNAENLEGEYFEKFNLQYYKSIKKSIFVRSSFAPMIELLGTLSLVLILYAISQNLFVNDFTPEVLLQMIAALGFSLKHIKELGLQISNLGEVRGVLAQVDLLENCHSDEKNHAASSEKLDGKLDVKIGDDLKITIKNMDVRISDISRFKMHSELCLANFRADNNIKCAQSVAIVGPTGSGKSTLMNCLAGLLKPDIWQANISWEAFSQLTAHVSQEIFIFKDSIRNNLIYPMRASEFKNDKMIDFLLREFDLDQRVELGLEEKTSYVFDPLRSEYSGGELQRLALIRALLREGKKILLLDEVSSALDGYTEKKVLSHVLDLANKQRKIVIIITHRLEHLALFDQVWFVENADCVLQGSHNHLIEQSSRYRDFLQKWS